MNLSDLSNAGIKVKMKKTEGYLTIYVTLSMTVLLSLCLTLIDGARRNAFRMEAEIMTEIGMDSILAEYHRELLEQYNLFFIDTSYGSKQPSLDLVNSHLTNYLQKNSGKSDVFLEQLFYRDFLGIQLESSRITRTAVATDNGGAVFRQQAIDAVKQDVGLKALEELKDWLDTVEGYGLDNREVQEEKKAVDGQIQQYDGALKEVEEDEWVTVRVENPTIRLEEKRKTGILNLVIKDVNELSGAGVDLSELISSRRGHGLMNKGNMNISDPVDGITDRFLFMEYVMKYGSHYGAEKEKGLLKYQMEYLIAGKTSDIENLKGVVHRISAMREAANAVYLLNDEAKCGEAELLAGALASAMLVPEIAPLLKVSLLLGWAYAESLYDVEQLLNGGRIPLIKDEGSWHYGINCLLEEQSHNDNVVSGNGLAYEDYLRILLALTGLETVTFRFMDIVEMDIRQTPGNSFFRIDGCIDRAEAVIGFRNHRGYECQLTRTRGYLYDTG